MGLGFSEAQDSVWGSCWKSLQKYVPPTPMVHLGDSEREEIERGIGTPRFIYVNRQGRVVDRQDYNRQGYIEDIYDLADFVMELKEFPREGKQLNHNKGLYEQMQNGNIRPYTTSLTLDDIRRAFEAGDRERQSGRRIQMQTGVEGMRVFNQALLDEFSQLPNPWSQRPLNENPLMRMTDFRGDEFNHHMDVEEGRFTYSVPYRAEPSQGSDFDMDRARTERGGLTRLNVWRTDTDGLEIIG